MKNITKYLLIAFMLFSIVNCNPKGNGELRIGVLQYSAHPSLDAAYDGFVAALKDNGYEDGVNMSLEHLSAQNDPTMPETLANKLVNDGSTLIYGIATPAAQALAQKTKDIPIIYSAVSDPVSAGLVGDIESSGNNITGASDLAPVKQQVDLLQQLLPSAKRVSILYSNAEENSTTEALLAKAELESKKIEVELVRVSDLTQIKEVVQSMKGKSDAIYIPTDNMIADGISTVTMIAREAQIPIISSVTSQVEAGVLASYGIDYYELGYSAGLQAVQVLAEGKNPSDIPTAFLSAQECELIVNKELLQEYEIQLTDTLATNAIMK